MTESILFSPKYTASDFHRHTKRGVVSLPLRLPSQPNRRKLTPTFTEEWASEGLLLVLFAGAITAAACSLLKVWNFVDGNALDHAVRAYVH